MVNLDKIKKSIIEEFVSDFVCSYNYHKKPEATTQDTFDMYSDAICIAKYMTGLCGYEYDIYSGEFVKSDIE